MIFLHYQTLCLDYGPKLITRTLVKDAIPTLKMRGEPDTDDEDPSSSSNNKFSRPYRSVVRDYENQNGTENHAFYNDFDNLKSLEWGQ